VGGKLLKISVGYFVRSCLVSHKMPPVDYQNVKTAEKGREFLCLSCRKIQFCDHTGSMWKINKNYII
jgi:hypothetical protein